MKDNNSDVAKLNRNTNLFAFIVEHAIIETHR